MKLKKAIIALYQKIVTVLYLYSYTNLSFQEVMLLWQRITAMIWMRPEIPRTNMTTEARTAVRTAPRTRARTITRTTVTNSVVGPFPVMDRKWAFYIWYSKTRRTGDGRMCQTVSMRQLEWWIQRNMPMYLIDVRDRESYEKGHLQGAVSIRGRVPGRECSGGTDGLPGKSFSELKMPYDTVLVADFALVSH